MKTIFALLACLCFAAPARGQNQAALQKQAGELAGKIDQLLAASPQPRTQSIEDKVNDCKIITVATKFLDKEPESAITPDLASLILGGLTRTCGYMNGNLRLEIIQAHQRGDLTEERATEFYKFISAAELAGPKYQGILRRAATIHR